MWAETHLVCFFLGGTPQTGCSPFGGRTLNSDARLEDHRHGHVVRLEPACGRAGQGVEIGVFLGHFGRLVGLAPDVGSPKTAFSRVFRETKPKKASPRPQKGYEHTLEQVSLSNFSMRGPHTSARESFKMLSGKRRRQSHSFLLID